jgi:hypothetical protein
MRIVDETTSAEVPVMETLEEKTERVSVAALFCAFGPLCARPDADLQALSMRQSDAVRIVKRRGG